MGWVNKRPFDHLLQNIEGQAAEFVFTQLHASVVGNYKSLVAEIGGDTECLSRHAPLLQILTIVCNVTASL
ncbi:hypothetical protein DPMN_075756 [Dreissena polymorpha]|uniref:Uncharacterized protein n=1 Tax=Dreissena polymorpha TaxID=45954 RepID=A0A9D3YHF5_DREPO|nr:hypothetical protein DPMN_075756 [Dreissena polymorpha]